MKLCGTRQDGFTIVEVMVAAVLLVVGSMAVFAIVSASTRTSFSAEQSQVASNLLQSEVERVRGLSYGEIALTSMPAAADDPDDPRSRVSGSGFDIDGGSPTRMAPLVVEGGPQAGTSETITGARVSPGPEAFTSGDVKGRVFRFIVWQDDPSCAMPACQGLKRIVIVVALDNPPAGGRHTYKELQATVGDPAASPAD